MPVSDSKVCENSPFSRTICLLIWLSLASLALSQQQERPQNLNIVASPTHGLYYMIECLADVPHRSPAMATNFRGRVGDWSSVEPALESWKADLRSDQLALLRFPQVQGRRPDLSSVLEKVALGSGNATELADRAAPWLGPEVGERFRDVLTALEPLYLKYWWPSTAIEERKSALLASFEEGDFDVNFAKASAFYRGTLPKGDPPTIALIPYLKAPGEERSLTRGHNLGNLQVVEVVMGKPDPDRAGACFHEFVHGLWSGQGETEQQRWQARFEAQGLIGRLAYVQLNEGLATAIGNGWFNQKVTGVLSPKDWYSDPVINAYGKALYPLIVEALEAGRPPTDRELDLMAWAFQHCLPEAESTFDVVAADFLTVSNRPEIHSGTYQSELMRLGPVRTSSAHDWSQESGPSTFTVLWLQPGEEHLLLKRGWEGSTIARFKGKALRKTDQGWELAFNGNQVELLALLRELQKQPLVQL